MTARLLPWLLPGALLLCASCASVEREPDGEWQSVEVSAPSDRVLWKLSLQSLQRLGYPLGSGMDPGAMTATTGWKTELHPFSRKGQRTMAVLRMKPRKRGLWTVEARVKRQLNAELARPLDPRYADWEWQADDVESARILLQHVRSALDPRLEPDEASDDPIEEYLRRRRSGS